MMKMRTEEFIVDASHQRVIDITTAAERCVRDRISGLLNVFVPHATAGLALMETGSGSESDLEDALLRLLPRDDQYQHSHGSTGHGADHLLPAFVSPSVTIPVQAGRLLLGTWQRIVLVDLNRDNPNRRVRVSVLSEAR